MTDLNCDMGEGFGRWAFGEDAALVSEITSASLACGFHAGDPRTIDLTVALAVGAGVTIGAHVSYPDLVGFGRRHLDVSDEELVTDVLYQIGALDGLCRRHGAAVRYVKAHGALYNDLAVDVHLAGVFADAVLAYDRRLFVLALAGSPSLEVMRGRGASVVAEAFADRAYTAEGRLVSRSRPDAMILDPDAVAERACRLAQGQPIEAVDGSLIALQANSLCVHGDSPSAAERAQLIRRSLERAGHEVLAFA